MTIKRAYKFSQELADKICEQIATGSSLINVCKKPDMPRYNTIMRWARDNEEFRNQYAQAMEDRADYLADEIVEIADDAEGDYVLVAGDLVFVKENVQRSKLKVETRKWVASKLRPIKYSERQQIDLDVKISIADKLTAARERAKNA